MKFYQIDDVDFFWIALKHPNKRAQLVLSTYVADAPAWDIKPVLERAVQKATNTKATISTKYFDLSNLLQWFRQTQGKNNSKAETELAKYGLKRWDFDDESDLVAYILKAQPSLLKQFEREPRMVLTASLS